MKHLRILFSTALLFSLAAQAAASSYTSVEIWDGYVFSHTVDDCGEIVMVIDIEKQLRKLDQEYDRAITDGKISSTELSLVHARSSGRMDINPIQSNWNDAERARTALLHFDQASNYFLNVLIDAYQAGKNIRNTEIGNTLQVSFECFRLFYTETLRYTERDRWKERYEKRSDLSQEYEAAQDTVRQIAAMSDENLSDYLIHTDYTYDELLGQLYNELQAAMTDWIIDAVEQEALETLFLQIEYSPFYWRNKVVLG